MNKAGIQDLRVKVDDYEAPSRQLKTSHLVKQDSQDCFDDPPPVALEEPLMFKSTMTNEEAQIASRNLQAFIDQQKSLADHNADTRSLEQLSLQQRFRTQTGYFKESSKPVDKGATSHRTLDRIETAPIATRARSIS